MDPEGSARERFALLQTAVRMVEDHPVLGVGLARMRRPTPAIVQPWVSRDTTTHT